MDIGWDTISNKPGQSGRTLLIICFTACQSRESKETFRYLSTAGFAGWCLCSRNVVCGIESNNAQFTCSFSR